MGKRVLLLSWGKGNILLRPEKNGILTNGPVETRKTWKRLGIRPFENGANINLMLNDQGHPTDRFGGISVRKAYNRLRYSVRHLNMRKLMPFVFGEIKMSFWVQKMSAGFLERKKQLIKDFNA